MKANKSGQQRDDLMTGNGRTADHLVQRKALTTF